jgi:hypothetical protein
MELRERAVASLPDYFQLSSLDALDLPVEIEGVFVFSHEKAQKHITVCA